MKVFPMCRIMEWTFWQQELIGASIDYESLIWWSSREPTTCTMTIFVSLEYLDILCIITWEKNKDVHN
jgi:hypothetical protein